MQQRASVLLERADKEGEVNDARRDKKKNWWEKYPWLAEKTWAGYAVEGLTLGVNLDSPSTVTKDKAVSNHPGNVVSVNLETCATVFLNVSVSFTETESKVFQES